MDEKEIPKELKQITEATLKLGWQIALPKEGESGDELLHGMVIGDSDFVDYILESKLTKKLKIMFKNFKESWKTTIMGIFLLIIPVIVLIGWVSPEEGNFLTEQFTLALGSVQVFISAIASVFLMFKARD